MTVTFGDAHLDTLTKLKALAEKHNMKIRFGTTNDFKVEADISLLEEHIPEGIVKTLGEYYSEVIDGEIMMTEETFWFELYDPQPQEKHPKYHVLTYKIKDVAFRLNNDWESVLEDSKIFEDDYEEDSYEEKQEESTEDFAIDRLIEFIEENKGDWEGVSFCEKPTIISGFGNKEEIIDGRVYRVGMALHYFTELVCEYLKEPMIHNTY